MTVNYLETIENLGLVAQGFFETRQGPFEKAVDACVRSLLAGGKIVLFGNGGSAAEAQHFAAELVNKFYRVRRALPALALTTDSSALTSIANDGSFDKIFSRQVEALGLPGDVAIGLSTSGASTNVLEGLRAAKAKNMTTIALTGKGGADMAALADILLDVPCKTTPRIQEVHLLLLHLLAEQLEERLAG
jgi:D-sedoheptulose 7-phosphate isomerase